VHRLTCRRVRPGMASFKTSCVPTKPTETHTLQIHFVFQTIVTTRSSKNTSTDFRHAALFAADALKPPSGISEEPQRIASIRRLYVRFKRWQRDRSFVRIPCQPKGGWLVYRHDSIDRVTRLNQTKAEDSQHEQTDRCSRRWPVRNGCIRTSFSTGSIGSRSCFDRSQGSAQEVDDPQEGYDAQEGSSGCCCFGRIGVSRNW
jgi:hypothetical protein